MTLQTLNNSFQTKNRGDVNANLMKKNLNSRLVAACLFAAIFVLVWACKKEDAVPPKSAEKAISAFSFGSLSPAVVGLVSGNSIMASVPFGTDLKLAPTITLSAKATVSPASGSVQDFSNTITYTVTAENATTQTYTVSVSVGVAPKSMAKDITAFAFNGLTPAVNCTIDATTKVISGTLPAGTDATKLVPTLTLSPKATVTPATGAAQDFSKDVTYTVTAEDGSTQAYTTKIAIPKLMTVTVNCDNVPLVWEDLGDGVDYVVTCNVRIEKDVVIKPGVKIQFEAGAGFRVYSGANFSLNMVGTKEKPIILEGKTATIGAWKGLEFSQNKSLKNQWEYVTVRHAGDGLTGGLEINDSNVWIKNCVFSNNKGFGISVTNASTDFKAFESNTFVNNTKSAIELFFTQVGFLDSKSSYNNNGNNYILIKKVNFQSDITEEITFQKLNVPYRIQDIIYMPQKLTLKPGVVIEFGNDAGIDVNQKTGALMADGTAADPIKLIGYLPNTKGVWAGILLESNNIENKLNYCIIDGAGSKDISTTNFNFWFEKTATAAVTMDGTGYKGSYRTIVTNCTITNSGGYGIAYSIYSKDAVTVKDNTFKDNTKANVIEFSY